MRACTPYNGDLTARIFLKLTIAVICVLSVALIAVDFLASSVAERTYLDTLKRELFEKGRILALVPPDLLRPRLTAFAHDARVRLTWVAADGRVLADSESDAGRMENHRHRPELQAALNGREGWSLRLSPTIGVPFLYVAVPFSSGALRLAVPVAKIREQVNAIRRQMLESTAIAFLPSVLIAAFVARYVSRRLALIISHAQKLTRGDFKARLDACGNDELGLLATKLNETSETLQSMFERLEHEHAELEKLERIRKDFVINVSHELRTPLSSIQGYTETLLDGAIHDPEHNIRFLEIIRQNADRLRRLTEDLLTLSRVELNRQTFHFEHYDVNRLLDEHAGSMQPIASKKRISLLLDRAPEGAEVLCDRDAVHQIVTNLVDNAIKYTPEGGTITIGARPGPDDRMMIFVRDTGVGIPNDDLPRLFERFYRVDKARSRELGGTGLGLAIVKHLVRSQGGEVGVESVLGKGSTFYFTLPAGHTQRSEAVSVQGEFTAL